MEELREVALEALDACQVRGITDWATIKSAIKGEMSPVPLQENQAQPHDPAGDHGGVMPGVCPPGRDRSKDWRPPPSAEFGGSRGVFLPCTLWEIRGKTVGNWDFPLVNQGLTPEEGSEPVLCVAMMLSVMVMSTGAVTITDADDISPSVR